MSKRPETHWFIKHPDHKAAINVLTQGSVTVEDIAFDCQEILGTTVPPTSIALGRPDNVVWPVSLAHTADL